jgi:hypothetical protein
VCGEPTDRVGGAGRPSLAPRAAGIHCGLRRHDLMPLIDGILGNSSIEA